MKATNVFAIVSGLAASGALAQQSPYYLTNGDGQQVCVVQNGVETNRWSTGLYNYPIAVSGGQVRICDGQGFGQQGKAYDLNGNFQGNLQQRAEGSFTLDGTSDGTFNYYASSGGTLFRTDLDWGNVTQLYQVGSVAYAGLTYDAKNKSIWSWDGTFIRQQDLATGNFISSFDTGNGNNCGLAWEPSSDTLWMYSQGSNQLRQYDKSGNLLNTVSWNNPFGDNVIGGEFEIGKVPAPGAATLLGIGGLMAGRRRR